MYTIIICTLIVIAGSIYYEYKDEWMGWLSILISVMKGLTGVLVGFVIAVILPKSYRVDNWSEELASLQDNQTISGQFFLGSGQINGTMKYVYYQKEDSNTFRMWQADYEDAKIRYVTGTPKVQITLRHPDNSLINKFAIDINTSQVFYVFEVPKGSIKNEITLDAQ
jgi:hypothetical protein